MYLLRVKRDYINFCAAGFGGGMELKMKILMTLMSLDIGGAETHVVELSKQLILLGHQVVVVSSGGAYVQEILNAGAKWIEAPLHKRNIKCMYSSYNILKKVIISENPDIVHAHARIPAFICGLIRKTTKFNFVTSAHGTFSTKLGLALLTNWGDYTLAVSKDIKKYLIENYKLDKNNIIVSANGVDVQKFSVDNKYEGVKEEFGLNQDAKRIIYMSRLNDDVCLPAIVLLDMFEEIEENFPGLEFMIIGEGDSVPELERKALKINEKLKRNAVILTGARVDVNRLISAGTVCIGVGRAILECMSMKKPVIVAGAEGYIGIFERNKYEVCIDTNFTCRGRMGIENSKFKDDIISVLSMTDEQRYELGIYGRGIVKNEYSIKKMVDDNLMLYKWGMRKYKYDAAILGYYGFKNSGDDALLYAMIKSLRGLKEDIRVNVLSLNPKETSNIYHVDSVVRYDIFKIYKVIRNSNIFILGGGSLIQDITSTKSIIYYLWMVNTAKKMNKKVLLYANGIGPVSKNINKSRAKKILNKVDFITLRDKDSLTELESLGVTKPKIEITADPVFCISEKNDSLEEQILKDAGVNKEDKIVCISVRKWEHAPENYEELCAHLADYIADKYKLLPVFIPMQYPYDASISRTIVSKMKSKGIFIGKRLDIPTTLSIVSRSTLIISVRLHMLIYAAVMSVPAIGIAYDPKVSNFQKYINQPYFLDPRALQTGDYKALVDDCVAKSEEIKKQLEKTTEILKEKAHKTAKIAIRLMEEDE